MAQVAKVGFCNTNKKPNSRKNQRERSFCFTLNNYKEEDIKDLLECGADYVFQEETGENGTKHLQGVLFFKNAISFDKLKKKFPRQHWEVCKNKKASIKYCSKEETRTGKVYANIPLEVAHVAQKKIDFEEILKKEYEKIIMENYYTFQNENDHWLREQYWQQYVENKD